MCEGETGNSERELIEVTLDDIIRQAERDARTLSHTTMTRLIPQTCCIWWLETEGTRTAHELR